MKFRRTVTIVGFLAICGGMLFHSGSAAPAADKDKQESLAVRYARAQLRLAEVTLKKANDMNRKMAGTLTSGLVSQFADDVEFAKLQLQNAMRPEGIDPLQACLERAELARRLAEGRLKKALEANQRAPGVVSAAEVESLRLGVELAQLRLERGQSLVSASSDAKLQWQLDVLSDELARVKEQTYLLGQNRLQQF